MVKTALVLVLAAAATDARAQVPMLPGSPGRTSMPNLPSGPSAPPTPTTATPAGTASKGPVERGTVLEEVAGKVAAIDRKDHKLTVETASGPVTLSLDRNTMVYTATGLGTVLDLRAGVQVRVGRNADFLAFWVQVRQASPAPASTPGQGTGPAGGGSAPAVEGAGGPGTATPPPPTTGAGPASGPGATPVGGGGTQTP